MKKICLLLLAFITLKAGAQNTDYTVSMAGIGPLKLGMPVAELEKTLGKKIVLKNVLDKENGYLDTVKTKFKGIDVILEIGNQYVEEGKEAVVLFSVESASPLCKTKWGIGIGADKLKVIAAHEADMLYIYPEFEDDTYTKKSKTRSVINATSDTSEYTLNYYLVNKKVARFRVTYFEGD